MAERIYRLNELADLIGLGRSTIYRMMDDGDFPKPIHLTRKTVGWRASEITAWLDSRPVAA